MSLRGRLDTARSALCSSEIQFRNTVEKYSGEIQWRNTVEKYSGEIQLRNTVENYSWEIQLRNTVKKYSWEIQLRNTVKKYSWEIQFRNPVEKYMTRHREIQLAGKGRGELDTSRSALYTSLPYFLHWKCQLRETKFNSNGFKSPLIHSMLEAGLLQTNVTEEELNLPLLPKGTVQC